jgi:rare lipoprotein A (peptidoglycan hydrolase)
VIVRVNDREPTTDRVIDVTRRAGLLGFSIKAWRVALEILPLGPPTSNPECSSTTTSLPERRHHFLGEQAHGFQDFLMRMPP